MQIVARALLALMALTFAAAAYAYLTLPDVRPLRTKNPSTTAFIEMRARDAEARGEKPRRIQHWTPYKQISEHLKRAVLVSEDAAFWEHDGIDVDELKNAIETNIERGAFVRGASTITQQLAKNLYLSPSKNPLRKLRELFITRRLEAELPKRRILELYLNVIEWGDGVWGADAAARTYFHKSAGALTADEAALLAAVIPNPRVLNAAKPSRYLVSRQRTILRRMGTVAPPDDADEATPVANAAPAPSRETPLPSVSPDAAPIETPSPPAESSTPSPEPTPAPTPTPG